MDHTALLTETRHKPRLGFAGVGWIGLNRMRSIVESGLAEAQYIADPAGSLIAKAKEIAPGALTENSFEKLLDCGLDGIVIATPNSLHAQQSIAALKSGMAVFCQKPLGRTKEEAASVVRTAKECNRLLSVDLSYRYLSAVQKIKMLIDENALGEIFAVNLVFHNAYGPDKEWFYNYVLSGGGCVIDLGIHLVDLVLWMFSFPGVSNVTSRLLSNGRLISKDDKKVEDYAAARFDLDTGTVVNLACSWKLSAGYDAIIEASFYGTKGGASLKNVNGSFYDFRAELYRWTAREIISDPPDDWGPRAALDWAKKLSVSKNYNPEIESILKTAEVLDMIYER